MSKRKTKRKSKMKTRNIVAKFAKQFNKTSVQISKKQKQLHGKPKHKKSDYE